MPHLRTPKFHTDRLVYRTLRKSDEAWFIEELYSDPRNIMSSVGSACQPQADREHPSSVGFTTAVAKALASIVICLQKSAEEPTVAGERIGWMMLEEIQPRAAHHRKTHFGMAMMPGYQGKGYGPEALSWLVEQAFHRHNLHRIEGEVFDFNEAALKAYEKVGFVVEGRKRESMWQEGRYRDEVIVGLLATEWRAAQEAKAKQAEGP